MPQVSLTPRVALTFIGPSKTLQSCQRNYRAQATVTDVEKTGIASSDASSEEPFDLEKTLRGGREEEEAAGIKSKRIGVVWDNLTVSGIGGVKNYVKVS
jgi:ATP-binding cassette subfamily G (WHITE) protein 2 (SNQ2)